MKTRIAASLAALLAGPAMAQEAPPPQPQVQCEPIDAVRAKMKQNHALEFGGGFINDHAILVLFATMRGEQWAAFVFRTDGNACYVTGGDGFVSIPIPTGPRV